MDSVILEIFASRISFGVDKEGIEFEIYGPYSCAICSMWR